MSGGSGRVTPGGGDALAAITSLQSAFVDGDENDDGVIDFQEALSIDPALYRALGLSNATELINEFDENGDGVLDLKEQTHLLRRLLPLLEGPMKRLQGEHMFAEAAQLRDNIALLRQQLTNADVKHARTVNVDKRRNLQQLKSFESQAHEEEWRRRLDEVKGAYDEKHDKLEHKLELSMQAKHKDLSMYGAVRPGMPLVPKYPTRVLELRALIETNSKAKNFEAAAVLKAECVALEREAEAKFAQMAPRALRDEEQRLREQQEEARKRLERKRIQNDNMLRVERDHDETRLHNRHHIFNRNLDHYSKLNLQQPVLRGQRIVLPPHLPHYEERNARPFSSFESSQTAGVGSSSMHGPKVSVTFMRRTQTPKADMSGRKDVPVRRMDPLMRLHERTNRPGTSGGLAPRVTHSAMGGSRPGTTSGGYGSPSRGGVGSRGADGGGRGGAGSPPKARLPHTGGALSWGWST